MQREKEIKIGEFEQVEAISRLIEKNRLFPQTIDFDKADVLLKCGFALPKQQKERVDFDSMEKYFKHLTKFYSDLYIALRRDLRIITEQDETGKTLLHHAALMGRILSPERAVLVQHLLFNTNGVDFSVKDRDGNTAVHLAALNVDERVTCNYIFPAFLEKAAKMNFNFSTIGAQGQTVLHIVTRTPYKDFLFKSKRINNTALVLKESKGQGVNVLSSSGSSAFYYAINWMHLKEARSLLDARADPYVEGSNNRMPIRELDKQLMELQHVLHYIKQTAINKNKEKVSAMIRVLLEIRKRITFDYGVEAYKKKNYTKTIQALQHVLLYEKEDYVRAQKMLYAALHQNNQEAKLSLKELERHNQMLMRAVNALKRFRKKDKPSMQNLQDIELIKNIIESDGTLTEKQLAMVLGFLKREFTHADNIEYAEKVVEILNLALGCDKQAMREYVKSLADEGNACASWIYFNASHFFDRSSVLTESAHEIYLKTVAASSLDPESYAALFELVKTHGYSDKEKESLARYRAYLDMEIAECCESNFGVEKLKFILGRYKDIDLEREILTRPKNKYDLRIPKSPLVRAAMCNNSEAIQLLVGYGASVNDSKDQKNSSALLNAVYVGNLDAVKVLLLLGANVDGSGTQENSPLSIAMNCACHIFERSYKKRYAIFYVLLKHGAQVTEKHLEHARKFWNLKEVSDYLGPLGKQYLDQVEAARDKQHGVVQRPVYSSSSAGSPTHFVAQREGVSSTDELAQQIRKADSSFAVASRNLSLGL